MSETLRGRPQTRSGKLCPELIAIPPLIFTFIAARQTITGLTAGAVKG